MKEEATVDRRRQLQTDQVLLDGEYLDTRAETDPHVLERECDEPRIGASHVREQVGIDAFLHRVVVLRAGEPREPTLRPFAVIAAQQMRSAKVGEIGHRNVADIPAHVDSAQAQPQRAVPPEQIEGRAQIHAKSADHRTSRA